MTSPEPPRTVARRTSSTIFAAVVVVIVVALVFVGAALIVILIRQPQAFPTSSGSPPTKPAATATPSASAPATGTPSPTADRQRRPSRPPGDNSGAPGDRDAADGAVPDGVTVFDDDIPAVANLDPDLLHALRQAATDAADDGVEFDVNSGWRSPEYQERLLREAVTKYGSEKEAARWVATPDTSPHVSGDAIDLGPSDATAWLSKHGADYGLCQIYDNEPWHYELRPDAIDDSCPPRYADPTHDPRMED